MSRSGYSDSLDQWDLIRWRGAVKSAIRGRRGQAFLREMRDALDAMPEKKLVRHELVTPEGQVCAMGAVCAARGLDVNDVDPYEPDDVADLLGIAPAMVAEIAFMNDESWYRDTPAARWTRMRAWTEAQIHAPDGGTP
jgi:hypothetical protein